MKQIKQILKTIRMGPVWGLALGTQAKSFQANPVIGSKLLNRLGLHIFRVLLARGAAWFRWILLAPLVPKALRRRYHKDGYVLIPEFISPDSLLKIRQEIAAYRGEVRQMTQGDTATRRILLTQSCAPLMPTTYSTATHTKLRRLLAYMGGKWAHSILYVQQIHNGFQSGKRDPQKTMHSDTFHPTIKAWLFLEDVSAEKGPFTYVQGSARLSFKRLAWEYKRSITALDTPDGYSEKGSLRADASALAEMGLPTPKPVTVKAGTLVIANTNGFHGRGQAEAGASRLELWAYSRHNPFSLWPGLPLDYMLHVKHRIIQWNWRRLDARAAARNSRASWHLIPPEQMVGAPLKGHHTAGITGTPNKAIDEVANEAADEAANEAADGAHTTDKASSNKKASD